MATITVTERAARHVSNYLQRQGHGIGVRLGINTTGCSGFAYQLEYADEARAEDVVFEQHGSVSRILRGYDIRFAQRAQPAQGDVFQIPDRAGDEREQIRIPRRGGWPVCAPCRQRPAGWLVVRRSAGRE